MENCRARQRNVQTGRFVQSAFANIDTKEPETVEEYLQNLNTYWEPASTKTNVHAKGSNRMVTALRVNGQLARVLFDPGTTGTNLMATN